MGFFEAYYYLVGGGASFTYGVASLANVVSSAGVTVPFAVGSLLGLAAAGMGILGLGKGVVTIVKSASDYVPSWAK